MATPLLAVLVFTTNALAILGLRALYFLLTDLIDRFVHLKLGLAVVLVWVGMKMLLLEVWKVPTLLSLAVTSDTYSHLLEGVGLQAATAAAALVLRSRPPNPNRRPNRRTQKEPSPAVETAGLGDDQDITAGQTVRRQGLEPRTRGLRAWLAGVPEHPCRCIVAGQRPCVDSRGPARLRLNQPYLQPRWHPGSAPRPDLAPSSCTLLLRCRRGGWLNESDPTGLAGSDPPV